MACPVSEGWQGRITSKIGIAAGIGVIGGGAFAVFKRVPIFTVATAATASCVIASCTFAGSQELVRRVCCSATPLNSFIAGGFSGYILSSLPSGHRRTSILSALLWSSTCGVVDLASEHIDIKRMSRRVLEQMDLIDVEEGTTEGLMTEENAMKQSKLSAEEREELEAISLSAMHYYRTGTWRDWLPFKRLSEEEWEIYQRKKQEAYQAKLDHVMKTEDEQSRSTPQQ